MASGQQQNYHVEIKSKRYIAVEIFWTLLLLYASWVKWHLLEDAARTTSYKIIATNCDIQKCSIHRYSMHTVLRNKNCAGVDELVLKRLHMGIDFLKYNVLWWSKNPNFIQLSLHNPNFIPPLTEQMLLWFVII